MEEPQEVPSVFVFKVVCLSDAQYGFCRPSSHSVGSRTGARNFLIWTPGRLSSQSREMVGFEL